MRLAKLNGYWTIFDGERALASFANFQAAWSAIYELWQDLKRFS